MAKYREALPQLGGDLFLTDGGIETTLVFLEGLELPYFAAFHLLKTTVGAAALRKYFATYAALAKERAVGCVLESATWRANADWGTKLGYSAEELAAANRHAVALLHEIRAQYEMPGMSIVVSGCIGPRRDGYNPDSFMSATEAERYHATQAATFRDADTDLVTAITMTYPEEAIGLTRAAQAAGMPVVISFTVETDGRLPNGATLQTAIEAVDAATGDAPAYYMINCAHPTHFATTLTPGAPWVGRIRGLRANASTKSHAELDQATALDRGNPSELATHHRQLRALLTNLNVVGGCCGTDQEHVGAICRAMQGA
ncbi:MAG: homocysteine S-methyltransferase family protein [Candidatus Binatia bacterium]